MIARLQVLCTNIEETLWALEVLGSRGWCDLYGQPLTKALNAWAKRHYGERGCYILLEPGRRKVLGLSTPPFDRHHAYQATDLLESYNDH